MSTSRAARCAVALAQCRVARKVVRESVDVPQSVAEAYDVQRRLHENLQEMTGSQSVGSKVGCTTPVMQEYLRVPHPCAGGIQDASLWTTQPLPYDIWQPYAPHEIKRHNWHHRIGLECEIAVVLQEQLGPGPVTFEQAAAAVGSIHAAVELVEDRYEDFPKNKPGPLCWLADDFFHGGSVLGPPIALCEGGRVTQSAPFDPRHADSLHGTMSVDGRVVGAGRGADIVNGHPLQALMWLASCADAAPAGLPPGWIVSLGSVCRTHWLPAPSEARDVTEVRINFTLSEPVTRVGDEVNGGRVAIDFI